MQFAKGFHPGTTWHKSDLQCHTPRDRNWQGSVPLPGGTTETEEVRRMWAAEFVAACKIAGLKAVAVTDHHDVCLSRYVCDAANDAGNELKVFPGIEVTCSDNAQCLVLFNPSVSADIQKSVLALAGSVVHAPHDDPQGSVVNPCSETITELVSRIGAQDHLKDDYVVLPHFSSEDAHKSLNEPGHHPRFANLSVDGVYIERQFAALDAATVDKIQGKTAHWGTRRRAVLATGDNRSANWNRLGLHECWIKLGEYSIEGLRQAMLADEARVSFVAPEVPSERIVRLTVLSSLTGPDPTSVTFNAGFNTFVGGRGSGKSAFLEYLRFGLGRTERDVGVTQDEGNREVRLIDDTLANGGFVEVVLEREGIVETWKRTLAQRDTIEVISGGKANNISVSDARDRFRARGFRQKGLSSTMNDSETAADQITGIAAAEDVGRQREIEQRIGNAERAVATSLNNLAAYWQARLQSRQSATKVADLRERIASIAKRLVDEGLSQHHLKTLENAPKFSRAEQYLSAVEEGIVEEDKYLGQAINATLQVTAATYESIEEFGEIKQLDEAVANAKIELVSNLKKSQAALKVLLIVQKKAQLAFMTRRVSFDKEYEKAATEQTKHKSFIDDNTRLMGELKIAETAVANARKSENTKASAIQAYDAAVTNLDKFVLEKREVLKSAADKVAGMSSDLLRARVKRDKRPRLYIDRLIKLFESSGTQQVEDGVTEWVANLCADGNANGWQEFRKALVSFYEGKIHASSPVEPSEEHLSELKALIFGNRALTDRQAKRIYGNINDASIGAIVSATPRDFIQLSYIDEGRAIEFRQASPGQQASALLELLLRQAAGTLIIDQPEDDLDNRVIMKIVDLLRTSKSNRQLIFTTHNPNVVVNGDADKIIVLKSTDPSSTQHVEAARVLIEVDGSIETPAIKDAITSVMEGGRKAFDLRGRKYGFEA